MEITKAHAANFLLARAGFDSERTSAQVIEDLSCLQVDPINVVARSHELILFNRVKGFRKQELYASLYKDRQLFEYWLQMYSIIPISALPYFKALQKTTDYRQIYADRSRYSSYRREHEADLTALMAFIESNGPTAARDIRHLGKGRAVHSWTGGNSHSALLEFLWNTGEIQISHRSSNIKYYDLTHRIIPETVLATEISAEQIYPFLLSSYFKYYGLVRPTWLNRSGRDRSKGLRDEFNRQLKIGDIIEVRIKGGDSKIKYYLRQSDLEMFAGSSPGSVAGSAGKLKILSPLDPLVLDRQLLLEVFGIFYRWEAYTPPAKRKYGFYNMPILFEDKIIGQIDLAKSKQKGDAKLNVNGIFLNQKSKAIDDALQQELHRLEKFSLEQ